MYVCGIGKIITGGGITEILAEKPVLVPLYPPST
jgi:hypothetical protein